MTDLFDDTYRLHRRDAPDTSRMAAAAIQPVRFTVRQKVDDFAKQHSQGFIDEELEANWPNMTSSTLRARRSELVDDGFIFDCGRRRMNSKGRLQIVWLHRDHHPCPPPLRERQPKMSKDHQIVTLEAKVRSLQHAMREALTLYRYQHRTSVDDGVTQVLEAALSA